MSLTCLLNVFVCCSGMLFPGPAADSARFEYLVLATSKTSTMEKEMNDAAGAGFVFSSVMGGETSLGGKEVVVVMSKDATQLPPQKRAYKLLAARKTSTMQKEMQQLGDDGFDYKGQTVFESLLGGKEVVVIAERDDSVAATRIEYRLLATAKTATLQKELREASDAGFLVVGITVAETALGGREVVCILKKQ